MMAMASSATVAGVDIGGSRKGCHLVILRGCEIVCNVNSRDPSCLAGLCIEHKVTAVGIDSPCRWGLPGGGRPAERALSRERIFSFSTPTRERAKANTSGFYGWMFNGEAVYQAMAETHPLLTDECYSGGNVCFETFPHAVACAMLGTDIASAKRKRVQRRQLLEDAGISTRSLRSIDAVDAALCALTAHFLVQGNTYAYGDKVGGYILVPDTDWPPQIASCGGIAK